MNIYIQESGVFGKMSARSIEAIDIVAVGVVVGVAVGDVVGRGTDLGQVEPMSVWGP